MGTLITENMRFIDYDDVTTVDEVISLLEPVIENNADEDHNELFFAFEDLDKYISGARYLDNLERLLLETSTNKADAIEAKLFIDKLKMFDPGLNVVVQNGWIIKPISELEADDYCDSEGVIQLTDYGEGDIRLRGIDDLKEEMEFIDADEDLRVVCLDENGDVYPLSFCGEEDGCIILNALKDKDIRSAMTVSNFSEIEDDCGKLAINFTNDGEHYVLRAMEVGPFGEGVYDDECAYRCFIKISIDNKVVVACRLGDIIRGEDHNYVLDTPAASMTKDEVINYLKNWYIPYLKSEREVELDEATTTNYIDDERRSLAWAAEYKEFVRLLESLIETEGEDEVIKALKERHIPKMKRDIESLETAAEEWDDEEHEDSHYDDDTTLLHFILQLRQFASNYPDLKVACKYDKSPTSFCYFNDVEVWEAGEETAVVLVHSDKKRSSFTVSELLNIEDIEGYQSFYLVANEQIGDCEMRGKPFPIRMPAMEKVVLIVDTPYGYNFVETPQKGMFFKAKDGDEDIIAFNSDGDFDNEGFWENNEYDDISHLGEYSSVEECQSRASALQRIVDQLEIILKGNLGDEDED